MLYAVTAFQNLEFGLLIKMSVLEKMYSIVPTLASMLPITKVRQHIKMVPKNLEKSIILIFLCLLPNSYGYCVNYTYDDYQHYPRCSSNYLYRRI